MVGGDKAYLSWQSQLSIAGLSLAHELGHLAGLNHDQSTNSLMSPILDTQAAALKEFPTINSAECTAISALVPRFQMRHPQWKERR
jgi:hypothetical protein